MQEVINDTASDLTMAIRRLLLEGDYPLVQYDIVSAKALQDALQVEEGVCRCTPQQVAHVLREEGFQQVGRYTIGQERHYIWTRSGVDQATAAEVAMKRVKENKKNLCMELIYG